MSIFCRKYWHFIDCKNNNIIWDKKDGLVSKYKHYDHDTHDTQASSQDMEAPDAN